MREIDCQAVGMSLEVISERELAPQRLGNWAARSGLVAVIRPRLGLGVGKILIPGRVRGVNVRLCHLDDGCHCLASAADFKAGVLHAGGHGFRDVSLWRREGDTTRTRRTDSLPRSLPSSRARQPWLARRRSNTDP